MSDIPPKDKYNVNNVVVDSFYVEDVSSWDLENELMKARYDELNGWMEKESPHHLDDGFIVTIYLNNQLDEYKNGLYGIGLEKNYSLHNGISIIEFGGLFIMLYTLSRLILMVLPISMLVFPC